MTKTNNPISIDSHRRRNKNRVKLQQSSSPALSKNEESEVLKWAVWEENELSVVAGL